MSTSDSGLRKGLIGRLGVDASVYALPSLLRQALVFAVLPILADRVPPEEFGKVTVAIAIAAVASVIMGLGLETPLYRGWLTADHDHRKQRQLLATTRALTLTSTFVAFVIVSLWLCVLGPSSDAIAPTLVVIAMFGAAAQAQLDNQQLPVLRARDARWSHLAVQMSMTVAHPTAIFILVVVVNMSALGWTIGVAAAPIIGLVVSFLTPMGASLPRLHLPTARGLLSLALPLVPHALAHWSLAAVDRIMLTGYTTTREIGIYGMAYAYAATTGVVLTAVNKALMPEYLRTARAFEGVLRRQLLGRIAEVQFATTVALGVIVATVGRLVYGQIFPPAYQQDLSIITLVAVAYVLFGLYYIPVDTLVLIDGKSTWLSVATAVGAAVNAIANLVLIPKYGIRGAALATVLGYGAMLSATTVRLRRASDSIPSMDARRCTSMVLIGLFSIAPVALISVPPLKLEIALALGGTSLASGYAWRMVGNARRSLDQPALPSRRTRTMD